LNAPGILNLAQPAATGGSGFTIEIGSDSVIGNALIYLCEHDRIDGSVQGQPMARPVCLRHAAKCGPVDRWQQNRE
jgi:hypothetical protein